MENEKQTEESKSDMPEGYPQSERKSDGVTSARHFNPSNNPVVDGVKSRVEDLANYIKENVPAGRHQSIALTKLETASMYAVKANFYKDGERSPEPVQQPDEEE